MAAPEHLREPTSFALARIVVIMLLSLALGGIVAFNFVRFSTSPLILRQSYVEEPIYFPSLLINVNDYGRNDDFSVLCTRSTRNTAAENGVNNAPLSTVANATRGQDYELRFFVDPPYQPAESFLLDARTQFTAPLVSFSPNVTRAFDVMLSCQVNVTNTQAQSNYILGDVSIQNTINVTSEGVPNNDLLPLFDPNENVFLMIDQQFFNIQLLVTKYCWLSGACQYRQRIEFSQSSQLPATALPAGAASLGRNIFSVQVMNEPSSTHEDRFRMQMVEERRSYGYLEILSSVLSFFSLLILLYAALMGGRRVSPLGFVQLALLRRDARDYVRRVEEGAGNEVQGLRDLLFKFYLRGHYVPMVPPGKEAADLEAHEDEMRYRGATTSTVFDRDDPLTKTASPPGHDPVARLTRHE